MFTFFTFIDTMNLTHVLKPPVPNVLFSHLTLYIGFNLESLFIFFWSFNFTTYLLIFGKENLEEKTKKPKALSLEHKGSRVSERLLNGKGGGLR